MARAAGGGAAGAAAPLCVPISRILEAFRIRVNSLGPTGSAAEGGGAGVAGGGEEAPHAGVAGGRPVVPWEGGACDGAGDSSSMRRRRVIPSPPAGDAAGSGAAEGAAEANELVAPPTRSLSVTAPGTAP
jgi:hypothetical protein